MRVSNKSKKGIVVIMFVITLRTLGCVSRSQASLQAVGPINPANGFPFWYQDVNGVTLGLCVGSPNCLADAVVAGNAFSAQIGFGTEAFWWGADALVGGPPPAPDAGLVLATEAAFGNLDGSAQDGFQITFNRVRIRVSGAAANETCTIIHPFSAALGDPFVTDAVGVINTTVDFGCVIDPILGGLCNFAFPLTVNAANPISVFLTPVAGTVVPAGFIGDGLTDVQITGSPTGNNLFSVDCPSFAAPLTTNLFIIQGQLFSINLTAAKAGNGTGTVVSDIAGVDGLTTINCGPACVSQTVAFAPFSAPGISTVVNLTPTPSATSVFSGWTGCDTVAPITNVCTVTLISTARTVTSTFNEAKNITAAPAAIDVGAINAGSTVLRTVNVSNTGATTNLLIGAVTLAPATDFTMLTNTCSNATLAPAATCLVEVMYLKAGLGASTATLAIPSDDPQTPIMNVTLSANSVLVPAFTDVPEGAFAENFINSLFYNGITGGCGGANYCPDNTVTRGQMAVFIETSLGVTVPPACLGNVFSDVTAASVGAGFCGYIEKLAADGITGGCGGSNFCPNAPVTRGQMAVFIEAALNNPANACANTFTDSTLAIVGPVVCGFIERLAADGITGGCGGTNFCPTNPVTRAQMAVFIVAAPAPMKP